MNNKSNEGNIIQITGTGGADEDVHTTYFTTSGTFGDPK